MRPQEAPGGPKEAPRRPQEAPGGPRSSQEQPEAARSSYSGFSHLTPLKCVTVARASPGGIFQCDENYAMGVGTLRAAASGVLKSTVFLTRDPSRARNCRTGDFQSSKKHCVFGIRPLSSVQLSNGPFSFHIETHVFLMANHAFDRYSRTGGFRFRSKVRCF